MGQILKDYEEAMRLPFYISNGQVIGPDGECWGTSSAVTRRSSLCRKLNMACGIGVDKGRAEGIEAAAKAAKDTA